MSFFYRLPLLAATARIAAIGALLVAPLHLHAQWQAQSSGTSASLRGIHVVSGTSGRTAWASGSGGTVLRTVDGGWHWHPCAVPPGGAKLDFRSVWAWDADDGMVVSSGPGSASKLYSTHDGCKTWRLVFTNPDPSGFWDGLQFDGARFGVILGDPVHGRFTLFVTYDGGSRWTRQLDPCLQTMSAGQGAFAASNQSMAIVAEPSTEGVDEARRLWFGASSGWLYGLDVAPLRLIGNNLSGCVHQRVLPRLFGPAAGIFAVAFQNQTAAVAVGGDYTKPRSRAAAAYTQDGSQWQRADASPAGFRSTVSWNASDGEWIAAGPTGSDISRDNGKTWQPLDPAGWNAISLPFAVGENGHIGRLVSWGQLRASNHPRAADATLAAR